MAGANGFAGVCIYSIVMDSTVLLLSAYYYFSRIRKIEVRGFHLMMLGLFMFYAITSILAQVLNWVSLNETGGNEAIQNLEFWFLTFSSF